LLADKLQLSHDGCRLARHYERTVDFARNGCPHPQPQPQPWARLPALPDALHLNLVNTVTAPMPTARRPAAKSATASAKAAAKSAGAAAPAAGESAAGAGDAASAGGPRVLKKYPNRRLYDTTTSAYITLADVKGMVLAQQDFVVRDAKTGDDLTRAILLQIILEEEAGGAPIFSEGMLSNLIRFYGHAMQGLMGATMERNLQGFAEMQQRFAEHAKGMAGAGQLPAEMWSQFLSGQAPAVQNLMGTYLEQSQSVFQQMQEQMAKQAGSLFAGVPGMPGFTPPKR
jgi:polyhydroxyalkanoate synthesis repressor PhaR